MAVDLDPNEIRNVNLRYHEDAAEHYDTKWSVGFSDPWRTIVSDKAVKLLGDNPCFENALEVGAGTGYFGLNLLSESIIESLTCTDISPKMLEALQRNAATLGAKVTTEACDATTLPFEDKSFDLVCGHAILHHLPELDRSFSEFYRVLKPGGYLLFAGEPSLHGDRMAKLPKLAGHKLAPTWRRTLGIGAAPQSDDLSHELESFVDVHTFSTGQLRELLQAAGFSDLTVRGEELSANWFGWVTRLFEASAKHDDIPPLWFKFAFHGYGLLRKLDEAVFERVLPQDIFYNLVLAARKPA